MTGTVFFIDIDATLADASERYKAAGPKPSLEQGRQAYDRWLGAVQNEESLFADEPVPGMCALVQSIALAGYSYVYLTAREEKWRGVTEQWLMANDFPLPYLPDSGNYYRAPNLLMAKTGYYESSGDYKARRIVELAKGRSVVILDDDPEGDLWPHCQKHGWTLLRAHSGGTPPLDGQVRVLTRLVSGG